MVTVAILLAIMHSLVLSVNTQHQTQTRFHLLDRMDLQLQLTDHQTVPLVAISSPHSWTNLQHP